MNSFSASRSRILTETKNRAPVAVNSTGSNHVPRHSVYPSRSRDNSLPRCCLAQSRSTNAHARAPARQLSQTRRRNCGQKTQCRFRRGREAVRGCAPQRAYIRRCPVSPAEAHTLSLARTGSYMHTTLASYAQDLAMPAAALDLLPDKAHQPSMAPSLHAWDSPNGAPTPMPKR